MIDQHVFKIEFYTYQESTTTSIRHAFNPSDAAKANQGLKEKPQDIACSASAIVVIVGVVKEVVPSEYRGLAEVAL